MPVPSVIPDVSAECVRLDDRRKRQRPSPYFTSGAPTQCARCAAPFQVNDGLLSCWHGDKGYYCSEACARMDKSAA